MKRHRIILFMLCSLSSLGMASCREEQSVPPPPQLEHKAEKSVVVAQNTEEKTEVGEQKTALEKVKAGEDCPACDLSETDLNGANLEGANLEGANLQGTYLNGANLKGTYLVGADLTRAQMENTELTEANLEGANLTETNLHGADFTGANLTGINLERIASLRGVIFCQTTMPTGKTNNSGCTK